MVKEKDIIVSEKYYLIFIFLIFAIIAIYFTYKIIYLHKLSNPYYEISDSDKKLIINEFKTLPVTSQKMLIVDIDKFINKSLDKFGKTGGENIDKIFKNINFDLERFYISSNSSHPDSEINNIPGFSEKELNEESSKMASGNLSNKEFDKSLYKLEIYQREKAKIEEKRQRERSELNRIIQRRNEYFDKTIPYLMAIMKEINPNYEQQKQSVVSTTLSSAKPEPSPPKMELPPFNDELMGIKYVMTIEDENLFCYVDDSWKSFSVSRKKEFIKKIAEMRYFDKTDFVLRNKTGKDIADYHNGAIDFFVSR